jgi:hypothetical protein
MKSRPTFLDFILSISIKKYSPSFTSAWNEFVAEFAKNATFIFHRNFMEYHKARFADFSLLIFSHEKLVAIFPANFEGKTVFSHGGLSYGGLIFREEIKSKLAHECWQAIVDFYKLEEFEKLVYKPIPAYYHLPPTHEDSFSLFQLKAEMVQVKNSSVIDLKQPKKYQTRKRRNIRKAEKASLEISATSDLEKFWNVLTANLWEIHQAKPVHSLIEITSLNSKFPENIKLYTSEKNGKILAGTLLFISRKAIHTQYLINSPEGRTCGALDFLIAQLITKYSETHEFFSLGTSFEEKTQTVNWSLREWKEGFGAVSFPHFTYEILLEESTNIGTRKRMQ